MPKITELPVATSVSPDDLIPIVDAPDGGAPVTQHARVSDLLNLAVTRLAGVTWAGVWSSATTYANAAVVSYLGSTYISLQATNLNHIPSSATTWWQLWVAQGPIGTQGDPGDPGLTGNDGIPKAWAGAWVAGSYPIGTAVSRNGASYVAIQTPYSTIDPATDATFTQWIQISAQGATGPTPFSPPTIWVTAHAYVAITSTPANSVWANGNCYVCTVSHTSGTFATDLAAGKWALVASKGDSGNISAIGYNAPLRVYTDGTLGSSPGVPIISADRNAANGLLQLDAAGRAGSKQLINRSRRILINTAEIGGFSPHGPSSPGDLAGAKAVGYIVNIVLAADPRSTGATAYNQLVELKTHIGIDMNSNTGACGLAWVRASDDTLLEPVYYSALGGPQSCAFSAFDINRPAGTAETYRLYMWNVGFNTVQYNPTSVVGRHDVVVTTATPYDGSTT